MQCYDVALCLLNYFLLTNNLLDNGRAKCVLLCRLTSIHLISISASRTMYSERCCHW
uniref:Uncharacterized protein n=1 Tax=Aegilops tauschii subsp. strangulata TaxID=200361 RepID=A0A453NZ47_AEGTS